MASQPTAAANMATSRPLGDRLPPELANIIILQVLRDDKTAVILPRQISAVGAPRKPDGTIAEEITVTSRCALFRTSKTLRALYMPMFLREFRTMDVDQIIAKVEDFDIDTFWDIFRNFVRSHGPAAARDFPYDLHLSFTEDFLCHPSSTPLVDFFDAWTGVSAERFMHINYTVEPIPIQYVDKLQGLLNEQYFTRVANILDPEFEHVLGVFRELYRSRMIVRQEDRNKKMVGYWVQGRFVIKEAHEWKDEDLVDDQGEPLLRFD